MQKVVCFFINNISNSGGTERVTSLIANQLSRNGYTVLVISLFSKNGQPFFQLDSSIEVNTVFDKPIRGAYSFPLVFLRLGKLLRRKNVDVLINVDAILAFYSVPVCALPGNKLRNICWEHFNYHTSLGKKIRTFARTLAARYCDDIVTLTQRDSSFWTASNANIKNIVTINNPAPAARTSSDTPRTNTKTLLAVGRLTYQKGFDLLISAFGLVAQQRPDWVLHIVGNGEEHEALSQQIIQNNLTDHILLLPATPNIDALYQASSLYVMSSRFEGLPMVLLEATAAGLPVVSFDCDTGPSEVITEDFGWLCTPNNVDALAEALLHAFEQCDDPATYQRLCDAAAASASRFSIEAVIEKWLRLLQT